MKMFSDKYDLNQLQEQVGILENIFEKVRIIDPIKKLLINAEDLQPLDLETHCYDFWQNSKICENCVSIRAFNEQKTMIKFEFSENKLYMVTAIPLKIADRLVILEIIKDISDAQMIDNFDEARSIDIAKHLNNADDRLIKDELTKVYNKRFINERLPHEIFNSVLNEKHLSIIMADIDNFKSINDQYGHVFGDYVLQEFANELSRAIRRDIDWIARYGGDEFLIFLKETN